MILNYHNRQADNAQVYAYVLFDQQSFPKAWQALQHIRMAENQLARFAL